MRWTEFCLCDEVAEMGEEFVLMQCVIRGAKDREPGSQAGRGFEHLAEFGMGAEVIG
jgi:hypothetical protein